jgi:hypothetical protein
MKITKFLNILILTIFVFNINYVKSEDNLIPLKDLYKQQNLKSEIGKLKYLSNFSLQCGSLFQAINEVIPNNNILLASINLQEGAIITNIMIKKTEQRKIKEEIDEQIIFMKNKYVDLMNKNKKVNGEYIIGSDIISNDQKICKKFVPRFYKFLRSNSFTIKK